MIMGIGYDFSGKSSAEKFVEWAREFFLCSALTGKLCSPHLLDSNGKSVRNKLREFGLLPEPEPTDAEKLAVAEARIRELELVVKIQATMPKPKPPEPTVRFTLPEYKKFAEWAYEQTVDCYTKRQGMDSTHFHFRLVQLLDEIHHKLHELNLIPKPPPPEPTDAEKLAAAEKRIKGLEERERDRLYWYEQPLVWFKPDPMPRAYKPKPKSPRKPEDVPWLTVLDYLCKHDVCGEARLWVIDHRGNLAELWRDCKNGEWMEWWLRQYGLRPAGRICHSAGEWRMYYPTAPIAKELQ